VKLGIVSLCVAPLLIQDQNSEDAEAVARRSEAWFQALERRATQQGDPEVRQRITALLRDLRASCELRPQREEEDASTLSRSTGGSAPVLLKYYELNGLVVKVTNDPVHLPINELPFRSHGSPGVSFTLEEPEEPLVSADDIVTLIQENVDPVIWEDSTRYSIKLTPNVQLHVTAPADTHGKILALLGEVRRLNQKQVKSAIWLIAARRDAFERAAGGSDVRALGRDAFLKLLALATEGKDARLVGQFDASGFSGQKVRVESGLMRACKVGYCCDYGLSGRYCDGECMQVERYWQGVKASVRAVAGPEGTAVVETVLRRIETERMDPIDTLYGVIDAPVISRTSFITQQMVPRDAHVVLGSMSFDGTDAKGFDRLFVIGYFRAYVPE